MKLDNSHGYIGQLNANELIKANGEHGALQVVSQQFEAQFLQTVLKQMRSASDVLADSDNPLSPQKDSLYRDWHDAELAGRLSQLQSTGLAHMMTKQLSGALKSSPEPVASTNQMATMPAANGDISSQSVATKAMQPALIAPTFNQVSNK
ncbi:MULTISPECIES: rod-binding protein [Shewanella]|uniref:rod-binding protein n=1 Tax=Shewanella TaxID=22 RepID=UPI000490E84F|nr:MULTISPECIES: rod-binding protein [Shewanella]QLE87564.1 peptidoglycan hydrolase [Shewanella sp. Scap07]